MAIIQSGANTSVLATVDSTYNALNVIQKGTAVVDFNPADFTTDSFERLRVSEPQIAFEHTWANGATSTIWETGLYGAGTITANTNAWTTELNSTTAASTGSWVQTFQKVRYAPGLSSVLRFTFSFNALITNVVSRVGMFNDQGTFPTASIGDGIFLEANGTTISFVRRTYTSGALVEVRDAQSTWNLDKLNGTGASGVNLDFTQCQHLVIEYQWLGVGTIRYGFETGPTGVIWAHEQHSVNNLNVPWCRTGSLPVRAECYTTGTASVAGRLVLINCVVIQEGLTAQRGWKYFSAVANTSSTKTIGLTAGSLYPIMALRANTTNDIQKQTTCIPINAQIVVQTAATTSTVMQWALLLQPTPMTTATFLGSPGLASNISVDQSCTTGNTTAVTGQTIAGGVLPNLTGIYNLDFSGMVDNIQRIGQWANNTTSIIGAAPICLAYGPLVTNSGAGAMVTASMTWKELS